MTTSVCDAPSPTEDRVTESPADDELTAALRAATDGDPAAFAVLWRALHPAVLRYLRVVCADAAEDVASETWLQVSRDLSRFHGGPVAFRVWLFRIARNRGIDENRRAWRRREQPVDTLDDTRHPTTAHDPLADVLELSGTARAIALIRTLPTDQAEAVMLRVVAGLDVADTARVLGKRPGAVRVAAMRGLRRLAVHPHLQDEPGPAPAEPAETKPRSGRDV